MKVWKREFNLKDLHVRISRLEDNAPECQGLDIFIQCNANSWLNMYITMHCLKLEISLIFRRIFKKFETEK